MTLLDPFARYLHERGVGVYDPAGQVQAVDWSIFPDHLPDEPGRAICLTVYGPGTGRPDPGLPWADARFQARVRGSADPTESRGKAEAIYGALHGLATVALPGGLWVQEIQALQAEPAGLGAGGTGRHEHVINFEVSYDQPTALRPALEG